MFDKFKIWLRKKGILPLIHKEIDIPFDRENSINVARITRPCNVLTGEPMIGEYIVKFDTPLGANCRMKVLIKPRP